MDKENFSDVFDFAKKNPKHFIYLILILMGIIGALFFSIYSIQISNKSELLDIEFNTKKENLEDGLKIKEEGYKTEIKVLTSQRDTYKLDLERKEKEIIKDEINEGALNITITNNNNNMNSIGEIVLNSSCNEKDYFIGELSKKVNSKNDALNLCIENNNDLTIENEKLNQENRIIKNKLGLEKDFLEEEFQIYNFKSKEFENGNFGITVKSILSGKTSIRINGIDFNDLTRGSLINFSYDDENYNLRVNEINDNCQSNCYTGETNRNVKIRIYE